jgi:ribosome-associated protein
LCYDVLMKEDRLVINHHVAIPWEELHFRFSRSGGPGGQNVNRVATRVELLFDLAGSPSLTEEQRQRARQVLASHLDAEGTLRLVADSTPSQWRNRQEVVRRFRALLRQALRVPRPRRATTPPPQAREERLAAKRHRSQVKRRRGQTAAVEE